MIQCPARKILLSCAVIRPLIVTLLAWGVYVFLPASCSEPARRAAAIFMLGALFWAFEIFPLYATSVLVILLETLFLTQAGGVWGLDTTGPTTFFAPFADPVIILFLGGFVLAGAFHKYGADAQIARLLLERFGTHPFAVLMGFMATTAFLSMWMSNTATTALMLAMIHPMLGHLRKDNPLRKGLVLAIAFAANIGGMGTPVGSPPNAIAVGFLAEQGIRVDFLAWTLAAFPFVLVFLVVTGGLLYFFFPSSEPALRMSLTEPASERGRILLVFLIGLLTAGLWLTSPWHRIPESVVALLSVALMGMLGLTSVDDLKKIDWDILVLMWGGLALGKGMEVTGLGKWLVSFPMFAYGGMTQIIVFCLLSVLLSTFMSNTAAVNMLLPLAVSVSTGSPVVLAMVITFSSSLDIALPVSTPPMAMAYGTREVTVKEMLAAGLVITLVTNTLVVAALPFVVGKIMGASL